MRELREDRRPADLWFWSDWLASVDVRSCSLAAQGLWVNMLAVMSRSDRKGFLSINGKPMDSKELAKFVGVFKDEIEELLVELEYYKVFSRDVDGTIYNRRMKKLSELSQKRSVAGRLGGLKQNRSKDEAKDSSKAEATLDSDNEYNSSLNKNLKGVPASFDEWWERYPRKVARKVAAKAYAAEVKAGAAAEDLLRAADGYAAEIRKNGTEEKFTKHPSTFLREERWRDYLDVPTKMPLKVGDPGDVALGVARATARNKKNFPELEEK